MAGRVKKTPALSRPQLITLLVIGRDGQQFMHNTVAETPTV